MEQLIQTLSEKTDLLRGEVTASTQMLREYAKRLDFIVNQSHKNIAIRDAAFAETFNAFCLLLRQKMDAQEELWCPLRAEVRLAKTAAFNADYALCAKGLASKAKILSRSADEFTTEYISFFKLYRNYTEAKINVWLLTACNNDINTLTEKILFLARYIAKKTEKNRESYVG